MAQQGELGNMARRAVVAAARLQLLDLTGKALAGEVILPGLFITIERLVEIAELVVVKPSREAVASFFPRPRLHPSP